MKRVISTLGASTRYADFVDQGGMKAMVRSVLVKGGAGIVERQLSGVYGAGRGAPDGVATELSDEDATFLQNHKLFKQHQERGFVRIINVSRDANAVAQGMSTDEGSRPRNPADVKAFSKKQGLGKDDPSTELQVVSNSKKK